MKRLRHERVWFRMMRSLLFVPLLATVVTVTFSTAAEVITLPLWPGTAPGDTGTLPPEADVTTPEDRQPAGRRVIRIANVSAPTLTVYAPEPSRNTGAAVIVCPGGGYVRLAMDIEGTEVCEWLNQLGVTGIILKYRVPRREGLPQHVPPLQDAQRALGLVRQHAAEWGIDPGRIGIMGFSAGAHLSAVLSNHHESRTYPRVDAADDLSCRPDFALVIYPGYLRGPTVESVAPEVEPREGVTPPTFIAMTQDDPVHVENALAYYFALKRANVPTEMHLYPVGGHGYGLRATDQLHTTWPGRAADWMRVSGWLKQAVQPDPEP